MKLAPLIAALALAASAGAASAASVDDIAIRDPGLKTTKILKVTSPAITPGGAVPEVYTGFGKGVSPPVAWSKGPYGARSFVLLVEDPDAPLPVPFVHWMVWGLPAATTRIAEGAVPAGARQGKLMFVGTVGYMGPRPPDAAPHHYHFQVFALDSELALPEGAERAAVVAAMKGHVLASGELVGVYQKK